MDDQEKKFRWTQIGILSVAVILSALIVGGTTYYVLNSNFQKERAANQKTFDALNAQLKVEDTKSRLTSTTTPATNTTQDETANWKTYNDYQGVYSIRYPQNWVYQEYKKDNYNIVDFADTRSNLPALQSDMPPKFRINVTDEGLNDNVSGCSANLTKETLALAGKSATKYIVAPGCEGDFGSDREWIYYQISLGNSKYLRITNTAGAFPIELPKLLKTLTLK